MRELTDTNQRHENLEFNRKHQPISQKIGRIFATKICGPYAATLLNQTLPVFEWYVAIKDIHQIEMCYTEIGLCARIIDTILSSIVTTIGRALQPFNEKENLHFNLITFVSQLQI